MRWYRISRDRWSTKSRFQNILASCDSSTPSASALLLLNFHVCFFVLFICCNYRNVHFILHEQYPVIKILIVDVFISY